MDFNPDVLLNLLQSDLQLEPNFKLSDCTSIADARRWSLLQSIFKKWLPADTSALESVALAGFYSANARCATVSLPRRPEFVGEVLDVARRKIQTYFYSGTDQSNVFTLDDILSKGRAGPGSSRMTDHTDFYQKMFGGPLSVTNTTLYYHYRTAISKVWLQAELTRARSFGIDVVEGSNLSTVPKSAKTNRTICTEPSLNMFYQLGAGSILEELLMKYHNIDLSLQPDINKGLAWRGSFYGDFATIDLSSASDTISVALIEYLLPRSVARTLMFLRSPVTRYKEEQIPLHMLSSMGNGFTFPLQTLIFATLVRSTYEVLGITPYTYGWRRNYSVFGDDIICVASAYDSVVQVLNESGFIVNSEKSYNSGSFRESCGADYFKGHDIRGVYLKEVKHVKDIYSTFNRLLRWSAKHNIDITSALQYVKGLAKFQPVPLHAGDSEGFKCPSSFLRNIRRDPATGAQIYRALVAVPRLRRVKESDLNFNLHGAVISAVGGYIRGQCVSLRVNQPTYKVVKRKSPCWDYFFDAGVTLRDYQLTWESLV